MEPGSVTCDESDDAPLETEQACESADYADSLALGIGLLLVLTVLQRGIGFVRNVLFCRFLDPNELGLWNLAFSAVVLLAPFLVLGIPGVFGRYVEHFRQRGQLMAFLRRSLIVSGLLMTVGVAVMLTTARYTSWMVFGDNSQITLTIVMVVGLGFVITFNALVELCTALRQVRLLSYLQFANSFLFALFGVLLIWFYEQSAVSVMAGYAAACFVTSVAAYFPLWKVITRMDDDTELPTHRSLWSKILPFAGSMWMIALFSNLFAAADRYMIIHFCEAGPSAAAALVGQYHSSLIVPQLIVSLGVMMGSVVLPYLSHDWEQGNTEAVGERINTSMRLYVVGATAVGAVVLVGAPWLFSIALSDKYTLGLSVLPLTLVYCIWYGVFNIQQNYLFCRERASQVGVAMFVGLVANVGLNYFLLPRWGLHGAVVATSIANASALAYGVFWSRRQGLAIDPSTLAALVLPLCLLAGAVPATIIVTAYVFSGLKFHWIIADHEQQFLITKAEKTLHSALSFLRRSPSRAC